jgi:hypothetical protein
MGMKNKGTVVAEGGGEEGMGQGNMRWLASRVKLARRRTNVGHG